MIIDPLVSVIVITYNSSKYVIETLESIKTQSYKNIELIISDDCSTDETVTICQRWLSENHSLFIATELIRNARNTGIPANCNRGVKVAQGEWVKYIAGDDILRKDAIKYYVDYIRLNPDIKFLHSNVKIFPETLSNEIMEGFDDRNKYIINHANINAQEQFQVLLRVNPIYAPTTFINKELFLQYGYFDEKFRLWEDRPMWLKLTNNGVKLQYLDIITVQYRISEDSVQVKKNKKKIHSEFDILKDGYMMNFNSHLGFTERTAKILDYKRKFFLDKFGLNKISFFTRAINIISGYFLVRYIHRVNSRYKYFLKYKKYSL
jgi:alpha-1,3-rhamnosyltransferase